MTESVDGGMTVRIPSQRVNVEVRERREIGSDRWLVDSALPAVPSIGHHVWCWIETPRGESWRPPRRDRERFKVVAVEWNLDEADPDVAVYVESDPT